MKLVIFDCDGTLVDSQHMICAAMEKAYSAHGLVCPERERVLSIVGLSLTEAFVSLAAGDAHPVVGAWSRVTKAHSTHCAAAVHT